MKIRPFIWLVGCSCFLGSLLHAGWNEKFDEQSQWLVENIKEFQGDYQEQYGRFVDIRKQVLKDLLLQKQIQAAKQDQRMILLRPRDGLVIKKRANNNIYELFAWEVSYLLHGSEFLVPSFPLEISNKRIIIQEMEPFSFKKEKVMSQLPKEVKKVSLEEYWRGHILAYLLGLADLVGQNIGVNPLGHIRFFDMESSLQYSNIPHRTARSFKTGFVSQSLEWPQYRDPLDAKTAARMRKFVQSLSNIEEKLDKYLSCRSATIYLNGLLYRIEKVRSFGFEEGKTFRDFYGFAFPQIDAGLDQLKDIASDILGTKVDHGSALILICRWFDQYPLTAKQKQAVEDWIATYIDTISEL